MKEIHKIGARYTLPYNLLIQLEDPDYTSHEIEDSTEFLEFFSKELVLIHTHVDGDSYNSLINKVNREFIMEEKLIQEKGYNVIIPTIHTFEKELYIGEMFNYSYLSSLDDVSLFHLIRVLGPAFSKEILLFMPQNQDELYLRFSNMYEMWLDAYINGISGLVTRRKEDIIPKLMDSSDLVEVFRSGIDKLYCYLVRKENESTEDIYKDSTHALLLFNKLYDIFNYLKNNHCLSDDLIFSFEMYQKNIGNQIEYRLQSIPSSSTRSNREKMILI